MVFSVYSCMNNKVNINKIGVNEMSKVELDYTMWRRNEKNELVLDIEGKYKQKNKVVKTSGPNRVWTIEEKSILWDIVVNSKTGNMNEINRQFTQQGFDRVTTGQLSIIKRYISYNNKEGYLSNKSLSSVTNQEKKNILVR